MFSPKFYPLLFDYSKRWEVYNGSSGSGKSYFIAQKIIIRCCKEKIKVLVCRRYASTLRNSCYSLFKNILRKWKISKYVNPRETDFTIRFPNGSEIIMLGLDDEEKLLSLDDVSVIWVEETFETTREMIDQLNLRMRGSATNQQILLSFNPINKNHWLYDFCEVNPPSSFTYTHSTYKDNSFLRQEYIKELLEMITRNPQKARIFVFGEWGVDSEGLVLKNWRTEEFDPQTLASQGLEHRAGMDIGFTDPSAIIDTLYDRENKTIYVFNEFYKRGCQLSELVKAIEDMQLTKCKIYVDSADARAIQHFKSNRIRAEGCPKGKDSVKNGLMFLQDHLIIVHPCCKNFKNELENFSYIKSKQTGEWTDDTTHEYSHSIDACRYAYSDIYTNTKLKTFNKQLLSL